MGTSRQTAGEQPATGRSDLLVAVPTYNEAANIVPMVDALLSLPAHPDVLVVDDESPDGTARIAADAFAANPRVAVVVRRGPRGRGLASRAAYDHFCADGYRYLCEVDADFQESPDDVTKLLDEAKQSGCHIVVGSRFVPGGEFHSDKKSLSLLSACVLRMLFRSRTRDLSCSFHVIRRDVFDAVPPGRLTSRGFFIFPELHLRAERAGLRVREVACFFPPRRGGRSKISVRQLTDYARAACRFFVSRS